MAKTIIVDISPAGNVTIDAQGFTGEECVKATEQIEIALGGEMKRDTKPEFHAPSIMSVQGNKLTF